MYRRFSAVILLSFSFHLLSCQTTVRIRLYADTSPQYIFFSVISGNYTMDCFNGNRIKLEKGDLFAISRYENRIAVKLKGGRGFLSDSIVIRSPDDNGSFSIRTGGLAAAGRTCSGSLECYPDLGSLLIINTLPIEDYLPGVVKAEGGNNRNEEYYKTQAIIARTYTYRYYDKHTGERYNLCDGTHCQAYSGITSDSIIRMAVIHTENKVIVASDSTLIISAFHSNCGGETFPSEFVWLTAFPYLTGVTDPYCIRSRNAVWHKSVSLKQWIEMLERKGYNGAASPSGIFDFSQQERMQDYVTGSFRLPFAEIRKEISLRSAWFSVTSKGDSIILSGRGYGHGVGLCQEGAMEMAVSGKKFDEIIRFYYPGVTIINIDETKKTGAEKNMSGV